MPTVSSSPVTTDSGGVLITNYETIADLKKIPSLKLLQQYPGTKSWISDHVPVAFQFNRQNGKTLVFNADFVDAEIITASGQVQSLELHAPFMNFDEAQAFGLQLCTFLNIDSKDFLIWCNKSKNDTIDISAFSSKAGVSPLPGKIVGFGVNPSFNSEKPLYINLIFQNK